MPSAPPTFLPFSFLSNTLTSFTQFLSTKLVHTNATNSPTDSPTSTHHHPTHNSNAQLHFTASTSHRQVVNSQSSNARVEHGDEELLAPPPYPHTHSAEPQPGEFITINTKSHAHDHNICAINTAPTPTSPSPASLFAGMVNTLDLAVNDNYYQQQQQQQDDATLSLLDDSARATDDKMAGLFGTNESISTSPSSHSACCPPSSTGGATATDIMSLVSIVCHSVRRLIRSRRPLILCVGPNAAVYSTFIQHYFALIRGRVLNIHQVRYGEEVSSLLYVGGIVTCVDPSLLLEVDEGCFDVCFSFNMAFSSKAAAHRFIKLLKRTIKNGGAIAGTGIFVTDQQQLLLQQQQQQQPQRPHEDEDPGALSPSESFDELDCADSEDDGLHQHEPRVASVQWTLSDLRDIFTSVRFDIHSAIDLTLETNVFYAATSITPTFAQQLIHPAQRRRGSDVFSSLQFRRLPFGAAWCAARFLVTKHDELVDSSPVNSRSNSTSHHLSLPTPIKILAQPRRSSFEHRLANANAVFQDEMMSPRSPLRAPTSSPDSSPSSPSITSQLSSDTLSLPSINIEPSPSTSTASLSSSSSTPSTTSPVSVTPCPPKPCIVVPGVAIMLPRSSSSASSTPLCDRSAVERLLTGDCLIECLSPADKSSIVDMNSFQLVKCGDKRVKKYFNQPEQVVQVCSKVDDFDLVKQYAVPPHVAETLDVTYKMAIAAGLDALADAGINVYGVDEKGQRCIVGLPEEMRDNTGVIFASSFPCLDSCVEEVTKKVRAQTRAECAQQFQQQQQSSDNSTSSSSSVPASSSTSHEYEYDRKLLFKLLVMANCQLAELIKARGPNTHVNGACAGTTQALAIASDWITLGRCRTVIVVAADNATGSRVLQYVSTGFMGLGAHTTATSPHIAAKPFDKLRSGMILGSGAVALVLTDGNMTFPTSVCPSTISPSTQLTTISSGSSLSVAPLSRPKVRIVASLVSNSASHACLMDKTHIASQLCLFLDQLQREHGLQRAELASQLLYIAHETGTQACAMAECQALKCAFGDSFNKVLITNTKGYTGHAMAVAFEDVAAVFCLENGRSVCVPSFDGRQQVDPALGLVEGQLITSSNMKLSSERRFVLRFAAGFGSQLVYMLFERLTH